MQAHAHSARETMHIDVHTSTHKDKHKYMQKSLCGLLKKEGMCG